MTEADAVSRLFQQFSANYPARAIYVVAELGIADVLDETPMPADALARTVGVNPDALQRILRLLAGHGIFRDDGKGAFVHTEQSRALRSDHPQSQRAFIRTQSIEWKLLERLGETVRTGRPAIAALAPGGLFEYLASYPTEARMFQEAMTSKAKRDIAPILQAYDFSHFRSIIDVGGGRGHLIKAIIAANSNVKGILFDLPEVLSDASEAESERLSVQAGDFFKSELPACDAYLMMNVIHDWSDSQAVSIIETARRAARPRAKLLIIESVVPENPVPGPSGAHPAVNWDVRMLIWTGGRERSLLQFEGLFARARFKLSSVISTSGGLSVLECVPV
jgi:hypothetical protein